MYLLELADLDRERNTSLLLSVSVLLSSDALFWTFSWLLDLDLPSPLESETGAVLRLVWM